ncbi:MAG: selenocysteine-specific translation elongation factor [Planctomycetota bacterium]
MEILPIVIGTAGHIDHGKSTLVRALTGIDPDRLKEEQERGMTIDLGFAPLALPDGRVVGIVDVPGHERFVRNMVAGASGIDLVVLAVAADDGVMPQTREHVQIMQLLGVRRGIVALTKIDVVEEELVELAVEDVRHALRGTFLEDAPLQRVSAVTGEGLEDLRRALAAAAAAVEPRSATGIFRMPVQRVFSKPGFGTIVTGIPVRGAAAVGDTLEVLPAGARGKVRGLNAYLQRTERIRSGHSAAINLADVERELVRRGDVVATPGYFAPQRMLAARLTALPGLERPIADRLAIRFHTGTADPPGELVLLDAAEIAPGAAALVQVRLAEPVVAAPGDRFVLRLASPVVTLGGGTILEESRFRLKRRKDFVLTTLGRREESLDSPLRRAESALAARGPEPATLEALAKEVKEPAAEVAGLVAELAAAGRAQAAGAGRWMHAEAYAAARDRLHAALSEWFAAHPHRLVADTLVLRQASALEPGLFAALLEAEEARGALERRPGGLVQLRGREAALAPEAAARAAAIAGRLARARLQPPSLAEIASELGAAPEEVVPLLEHLADRGELVRITADLHLAAPAYEAARAEVIANCERHGHLEIPELRDRLQTTRKFLIPLLEHFDLRGLTVRQGAHRVLRRR